MNKKFASRGLFVVVAASISGTAAFAGNFPGAEAAIANAGECTAAQRAAAANAGPEAASEQSRACFTEGLHTMGVDNRGTRIAAETPPPIGGTQIVTTNPGVTAVPTPTVNEQKDRASAGDGNGMMKWLGVGAGAVAGGVLGYFGVPWVLGMFGICLGPIGALVAGLVGAAAVGFAVYKLMN